MRGKTLKLLVFKIDEKKKNAADEKRRRGRHESRLFLAILFRGGSPSAPAAVIGRENDCGRHSFAAVAVRASPLRGKARTHANREIMRWNRSVFQTIERLRITISKSSLKCMSSCDTTTTTTTTDGRTERTT